REERFFRAEALARLGEGHHLLGRHGEGARLARILPEGAVPAVVAAERGQRHEHLGGEGDPAAATAVAQRGGGVEERGELRRGRAEEQLGLGGAGQSSLARAIERAIERGQLAYCHRITRAGVTLIITPASRFSPMRRYCGYFARSRSAPRAKS